MYDWSMGIPHVTNWSHPCHRNFRAGILDECHAVFHVGTPSEWMICGGSCFWCQVLFDIFCWLVFPKEKIYDWNLSKPNRFWKVDLFMGFHTPENTFWIWGQFSENPPFSAIREGLHGPRMSNQIFDGFSNWWRSFTLTRSERQPGGSFAGDFRNAFAENSSDRGSFRWPGPSSRTLWECTFWEKYTVNAYQR